MPQTKIPVTSLEFFFGIDKYNSVDVTPIVLEKFVTKFGEIFLKVSINHFGDPYEGHVKMLYCVYQGNVIKTVGENAYLYLPSEIQNNKFVNNNELEFFYGANGIVYNVTSVVLQNCLLPDGNIAMVGNYNDLFGDPIFGVEKILYWSYKGHQIGQVNENQDLFINKIIMLPSHIEI